MSDDWKVFAPQVYLPPLTLDERAAAIADELAKGHPSKLFCRMLAGMIHPEGKNSTQYILRLAHRNEGRPKGQNRQVGAAMLRIVDDEGKSVDEAVYQVQQQFGVKGNSRRQCLAALKTEREARDLHEWFDKVTRVQKTK